jgi:hypothetical protein
MLEIAAVIPVLLAAAGAAVSGFKTLTKFRARHDLSNAIKVNAADVNEANTQLDAANVNAAEAVIRKYLGQLPAAERREAETALAQPSTDGRASYIRGIAARQEAAPET